MTISELIDKLSTYPPNMRVTLLDADTRSLKPIRFTRLDRDLRYDRHADFLCLTCDYEDPSEGDGPSGFSDLRFE